MTAVRAIPFEPFAPFAAPEPLAPLAREDAAPARRGPLVGAALGSGVPHWLQKRAPGGFSLPQLEQMRGSGWPHWMQNRAVAAFSVPQFGQIIAACSVLAHLCRLVVAAHHRILPCFTMALVAGRTVFRTRSGIMVKTHARGLRRLGVSRRLKPRCFALKAAGAATRAAEEVPTAQSGSRLCLG